MEWPIPTRPLPSPRLTTATQGTQLERACCVENVFPAHTWADVHQSQSWSRRRLRACARGQHPGRPTTQKRPSAWMTKHGGCRGWVQGSPRGVVEVVDGPRKHLESTSFLHGGVVWCGAVELWRCGGGCGELMETAPNSRSTPVFRDPATSSGRGARDRRISKTPSALESRRAGDVFLPCRPAATMQPANVPDVAAAGPRRPDICTPMAPQHWTLEHALGEGPRMQGPPAMVPSSLQANARPRRQASSMT